MVAWAPVAVMVAVAVGVLDMPLCAHAICNTGFYSTMSNPPNSPEFCLPCPRGFRCDGVSAVLCPSNKFQPLAQKNWCPDRDTCDNGFAIDVPSFWSATTSPFLESTCVSCPENCATCGTARRRRSSSSLLDSVHAAFDELDQDDTQPNEESQVAVPGNPGGKFTQSPPTGHATNVFVPTRDGPPQIKSRVRRVTMTDGTPKIKSGDSNVYYLRVTELMLNPPAATTAEKARMGLAASATVNRKQFQYWEFVNSHSQAVDIRNLLFGTGCQIDDKHVVWGSTGDLQNQVVLQPGGYALMVRNVEAFAARYGKDRLRFVVGQLEGDIPVRDDLVIILGLDGELCGFRVFKLKNVEDTPFSASGAIQRKNPATAAANPHDDEDSNKWDASTVCAHTKGSPGYANPTSSSACPALPSGSANDDVDGECSVCNAGYFLRSSDGQCQGTRTCAAGSYESREPSATQNRLCATCPRGEVQPLDLTTDSEHSGTICEECDPGTFAASSTECLPCVDSFQPHSGQSTCVGLHTCGQGEGETVAPTPTTDRECGPCPVGTHQADVGQATCDPCDAQNLYQDEEGQAACKVVESGHFKFGHQSRPCPAGYACIDGAKEPCQPGFYQDESTQVSCKACDPGTFSEISSQDSCTTWRSDCPAGQFMSQTPTKRRDRICTNCPNDEWQNIAGQSSCKPVTDCGSDGIAVQATPTSDALCTVCDGIESFRPADDTECQAVRVCDLGLGETAAPTESSDRECTACVAGHTYSDTVGPDANGNRACKPVTPCGPGTQPTAVTTTSPITCEPCPKNTFQGNVTVDACEPVSDCGDNRLTRKHTATTDVECTVEAICTQDADTSAFATAAGQACEACAINQCEKCIQQFDRDDEHTDLLLIAVDGSAGGPGAGGPLCIDASSFDGANRVQQCKSACLSNQICNSFAVRLDGRDEFCCLKSGFDDSDIATLPQTNFYALPICLRCKPSFHLFRGNTACLAFDRPPQFSSWTTPVIPSSANQGDSAVGITATSPDGLNVTYSLDPDDGKLAIDSESGQVTVGPKFTGHETSITRTVVATDARQECAAFGGVVANGGCQTTAQLSVNVGFFATPCPADIYKYIAFDKSVANVSWASPTLSDSVTDLGMAVELTVDEVATATAPTQLGVGEHNIKYAAGPLANGDKLFCEFKVVVRRGVAVFVEEVQHLTGNDVYMDFAFDSLGLSGEPQTLPPFQADVDSADGVGFGVTAASPFSLALQPGFRAQMFLQLQFCAATSVAASYPTEATVAGKAQVRFVGLSESVTHVFDASLSSMLADGSCFRVAASTDFITAPFSFRALDLTFEGPADVPRRQRRSPVLYKLVSPSFVNVHYSPAQGLDELPADPGAMLVLNDATPPTYIGCPSEPVVAVSGASGNVEVSWEVPTAIDNVAVVSNEEVSNPSRSPPSTFSIFNSPHTLTYRALDGEANEAFCSFDVRVDFDHTTFEVSMTTDEPFRSETSSEALLGLTTHTHYLIDTSYKLPSFTVDPGLYSEVAIVVRPKFDSDRLVARMNDQAVLGQIELDLAWVAEGVTDSGATDTDLVVTLTYEEELPFPNTESASPTSESVPFQSLSARFSDGVLRVSAKGKPFSSSITFERLVVSVGFPLGRPSQSYTFAPVNGSSIRFRYFLESSDDLKLTNLLTILDQEPPYFENCPTQRIDAPLPSGETTNAVVVSWTPPLAQDQRGVSGLVVTQTRHPDTPFVLRPKSNPDVTVTYTATDRFGLVGFCSFDVRVIDRQPPTMECPSGTTEIVSAGGKATFNASAWTPTSTTDNSGLPVTLVSPRGDDLPLRFSPGTHEQPVVVQDAWGNQETCTVILTALDLQKPEITCPPNGRFAEDGSTGASAVSFSPPTATDDVGVHSINVSHPSGSLFPVGVTVVTGTATDTSNNTRHCQFNVTVVASTSQSKTAGASTTPLLGGLAAGAALLFILLAVVFIAMRRYKNQHRKPQNWDDIFQLMDKFDDGGPRTPREIKRSAVRIVEELGQGAFGVVAKAILKETSQPGYLVAVKQLHVMANSASRQELMEEAAVMAQLDHENVVSLVGVVTIGEPVMVVLEFCEHGSLLEYLHKHTINETLRIRFASDVCSGLMHVHSKGFVHRDIAARNVLLSSDMRCKVADFGLAREEEEDAYYRGRGGQIPVRWTAPEALESRKFNQATDVWSFAVLMFEIWTQGSTPYKGWTNNKVWVEVQGGSRLPQPSSCTITVYKKMLHCWATDPHHRPTFEELCAFFKTLGDGGDPGDDGYLDVSAYLEPVVGGGGATSGYVQPVVGGGGATSGYVQPVVGGDPNGGYSEPTFLPVPYTSPEGGAMYPTVPRSYVIPVAGGDEEEFVYDNDMPGAAAPDDDDIDPATAAPTYDLGSTLPATATRVTAPFPVAPPRVESAFGFADPMQTYDMGAAGPGVYSLGDDAAAATNGAGAVYDFAESRVE